MAMMGSFRLRQTTSRVDMTAQRHVAPAFTIGRCHVQMTQSIPLLFVPVQAELLQGGCDLEHQFEVLVGLIRRQRQDFVLNAVVCKVLQKTAVIRLFD